MTRHGKNATANSVYSYHERKKDQRESGYGTLHERLGADSIKEFDCCSLTLQPCKNPVLSPDGFLFEKEAILEYILRKKKENVAKMKDFEKQQDREEADKAEEEREKREKAVKKFSSYEGTPAHVGSFDNEEKELLEAAATSSGELGMISASAAQTSRKRHLPSFWLPSQMKQAKQEKMMKPDQKVYCPMSGKAIKMKDFVPVTFTPVKDDGETVRANYVAKKARFLTLGKIFDNINCN